MPLTASMTCTHVLRRGSLRVGLARCYAIPVSRRNVNARMAATSTATTLSSCTSTLTTPRRTYYWPYPDNFIPEKAATSSFQSSPVPSVRERIVREYALSPLFGRRTPCCVLGFAESAPALVEKKKELRRWIAQAFGKAETEVELGPLQHTKEMMLHRSGTYESPRLADGPWSRPDAEQRRLSRYARLPVQARTLVEVYLPSEEEGGENAGSRGGVEEGADGDPNGSAAEVEDAILAHGLFLREQLYAYMSALQDGSSTPDQRQQQPSHAAQNEEDAVESSVAALHDQLGVVYCEVPALDESGFLFDRLHGMEVDADMAERVVDRWTRRVAQQQQREQKQKKP